MRQLHSSVPGLQMAIPVTLPRYFIPSLQLAAMDLAVCFIARLHDAAQEYELHVSPVIKVRPLTQPSKHPKAHTCETCSWQSQNIEGLSCS